MLIRADRSCLLLVDVQEKLIKHIDKHHRVVANCEWLLRAAKAMQIPILVSEQYPSGLGTTVPELRELVPAADIVEKIHFSCASDENCLTRINNLGREQIVVIGIEAHVCVLQTAIELSEKDKEVFVVVDAISSRDSNDKKYAVRRMLGCGIQIVTKEMVLFEWMERAGTQRFKEMSKEFLR